MDFEIEKGYRNDHVRVENNLIENMIRHVALISRKNNLFSGSHERTKRAAIIYSLVATIKLHNVETFAYLKDILTHTFRVIPHNLSDLLS